MTHGYLEKMLDMLTNAYNRRDLVNVQKGRPLETNIGKLFSLFAYCLELVHDNAAMVKSWDDLDNAEGSVLDRYGETYGVERGAASDALYRIFIGSSGWPSFPARPQYDYRGRRRTVGRRVHGHQI